MIKDASSKSTAKRWMTSSSSGKAQPAPHASLSSSKSRPRRANSLWSCARLCGAPTDEPGISVYEKSLAKDKFAEDARFRIVTTQSVVSSLRFLTYERGHSSRAPGTKEFLAAQQEIDRRCPNVVSLKGATSKTWLERTLWVEAPALDMIKRNLLLSIMIHPRQTAVHPCSWARPRSCSCRCSIESSAQRREIGARQGQRSLPVTTLLWCTTGSLVSVMLHGRFWSEAAPEDVRRCCRSFDMAENR